MNPAVMICYNNLNLTRNAIESVFEQDIPVELYVTDNGSTDGTLDCLAGLERLAESEVFSRNRSPLGIANAWMKRLFLDHDHILFVANDVLLPPNLYRKLMERPEEIVAAGMAGTLPLTVTESVNRIHGDVHLSVAMIRRSAYAKLMAQDGFFMDERFFLYASDCDLKLRLIEAGISTAQLDIECWHYGSAAWRLAAPDAQKASHAQADDDREAFARKWGFAIGSPEWEHRIAQINAQG